MGKMFKGCLTGVGALVLIIIVIMIIVMATGGSGDESSSDSGNNDGSSEESNASGDGESEETYGIGDEVQVGDVTYVINSMENSGTVETDGFEAEAEGTFIALDVEVTNNGSEAITFDSSYISLLSGGNTYDADSGNSELFLEQVNPDSTASGMVLFDVNPDVAETDDLQAQLNEGAFGSNSATVDLTE